VNLGHYSKTITALVAGVLGWAAVVITSDAAKITASEWLALGTAAATALGVYAVPNQPAAHPNRPLRADRGAVDPGSLALGIILGIVLGFLLWATR
jgi:hypothetical protein